MLLWPSRTAFAARFRRDTGLGGSSLGEIVITVRPASQRASNEPLFSMGLNGALEQITPSATTPLPQPPVDFNDTHRISAVQVRVSRGPSPVSGFLHQAGPDRIHLHVANGFEQVRLRKRTREEPALPQMPRRFLPALKPQRVTLVGLSKCFAEAVRRFGDNDPMNMVGHKAIGDPADVVLAAVVRDKA